VLAEGSGVRAVSCWPSAGQASQWATSIRYGRPEEIGTLVAFLASPLAGFANGTNYRIDGGQVQSVN
jgi:NAD(P)-dependent dehydrogenase (short-subunit alcohol dehydrogenase family)